MKKNLYIFLTLLLFLSGYTGTAAATLNLYDSPRDLPGKTIYDSNNKKFKLSDFKGDFVLAVFWSRYCAPCLREMDGLNEFSNKTKGKRAECRQIFKVVDEIMQGINLTCKTYSPLPDVYNSQIYQITASYEGVIRNDGYIFKN